MALRAVLLDVGNTLFSEQPVRGASYAHAARTRGLAIEDDAMGALMRRVHDELPREIDGAWRYSDRLFEAFIRRIYHVHLGLPEEQVPAVARELFERFSRPAGFALFPHALELCEHVRARGLVLGLVSNWSPRLLPLLEALGVAERVDFVLCSAVERVEKPDPELFERALRRAGVAAHEALHAGDDLGHDVFGAQRAGLRAVLVDHAGRHAQWNGAFAPRVTGLAQLDELLVHLST